jgi:hypothetical protein
MCAANTRRIPATSPRRAASRPALGVPRSRRWTYSIPAAARLVASTVLEKPARREAATARTSASTATPAAVSRAITSACVAPS